jgi:IclR family transcriptional regulator, acetate operon repressor
MPVNGNSSGLKLLALLERIAADQPVGVRQLAREMEADKSSIQRGIATLVDAGWVHAASRTPTRWQLTGRIHHVARVAHNTNGLRQRARLALEELRDATGETICLAVPDFHGFVIIEVAESRHALRLVPPIGLNIKVETSATGLAVLPYLSSEDQEKLLGRAVDAKLERILEATRRRGYHARMDERSRGSTNIAAPVFSEEGRPVAGILLCAPRDRAGPEDYERLGMMVLATSRKLSLAEPSPATARK